MDDLYAEANELFMNDDYENALELYSKGINEAKETNMRAKFYLSRSATHLKLNKAQEALNDAEQAISIAPHDAKAYLKKGMALFNLKEYQKSYETFEYGACLSENETKATKNLFNDWLGKCTKFYTPVVPVTTQDNHQKETDKSTREELIDDLNKIVQETVAAAPTKNVIKHEWYQTESAVIVSLLLKNFPKEDIHIESTDDQLKVTINKQEQNFHPIVINLSHEVSSKDTQIKYLSTKIEVKLKKREGVHWASLERSKDSVKTIKTPSNVKQDTYLDAPAKYPTSSRKPKNWDKLEAEVKAEEKDEKLEGDAAINKLFQQIYRDGSEEVQRAMNKSFQESGGTVLSTNWKDIGGKKVDVKPPDGLEWKKWH